MIAVIGMLVMGAPDVPGEIDELAKEHDKTPEQVCRAIMNIKLTADRDIDECEKKRGSKVSRIIPSPRDPAKCDPPHGHYTLVGTTCYCNANKHSEREILEDGPGASVREMHNLKNPCLACYYAIIKHMLDEGRLVDGRRLTVKYANKHPNKELQKKMTRPDGQTLPKDLELKRLCTAFLEEVEKARN